MLYSMLLGRGVVLTAPSIRFDGIFVYLSE